MKNTKPKHGVFSNIIFTFKNVYRINKILLVAMAEMVFVMVAQPMITILMPKFIVQFFEESRALSDFIILIVVFGVVSLILGQIRSFADGYFPIMKSMYRSMKLGSEMCLATMHVHYKYLSSELGQLECGKAQHAMSRPATGVEDTVLRIVECGANLIGAVVYIIILSSLSPFIILGLIACGILSFLAGNVVNRYRLKHKDTINKIRKKGHYVKNATRDSKYAKDIRMYGMFDWLVSLGQKFVDEENEWESKITLREFLSAAADGLVAFLRDGIAYGYLVILVLNNEIPVSEFILYISLIAGFSMWVSNLAKNAIILAADSLELSDFRVFMDKAEENLNSRLPAMSFNSPVSIEFRNVCFSYGEKEIFKNFDLKIQKGKKIALVGVNGAGKSTLVKLMLNLVEPSEGQILINDINSKEIDIRDYFDLFSVAFQDALVLAYGIDSNISMKSSEETDQERVDDVIKLAGLEEKINSLENGKYTSAERYLDDQGTELSGGERQKLILARALYKDAPFLILDEPSSALDPIAEAQLYEKYNEMTKGKTSIYISHRLSSTKFCDEVLLLDGGCITERGTHDELMKLNGKYAHMYMVQSHYYNDRKEEASA
ncbi:MAG: ABC transporter ATP-binding protein [Clostridia bacterium]|nr:ABC transporter ATP-binding protein [Clostridia bacterium]